MSSHEIRVDTFLRIEALDGANRLNCREVVRVAGVRTDILASAPSNRL